MRLVIILARHRLTPKAGTSTRGLLQLLRAPLVGATALRFADLGRDHSPYSMPRTAAIARGDTPRARASAVPLGVVIVTSSSATSS